MTTLTTGEIQTLLEAIAELLPFPTTLYADMGGDDWAPQLYFGPTDEDSELPTHRVGIEADTDNPVWWIDVDSGTRTILLDNVTPDDVRNVAASIQAEYPKSANSSNATIPAITHSKLDCRLHPRPPCPSAR